MKIHYLQKRNVRQLLNCLLRYGEWEKGTQLSLKVLDAALGRVRSDEFDGTVNKISAYDPVEPATLPFSDINRLATELLHRAEENPVYLEVKKHTFLNVPFELLNLILVF